MADDLAARLSRAIGGGERDDPGTDAAPRAAPPAPGATAGVVLYGETGRVTYTLPGAPPAFLLRAVALLEADHGFEKVTEPAIGLDEASVLISRDDVDLEANWNSWTGFDLAATGMRGDRLVRQLAPHLDALARGTTGPAAGGRRGRSRRR